jgi:ABC-type Mn2+/Zn2+ transport system permease subunit
MANFINSLQDFYHFEFLSIALISTILLSIVSGLISPFIIARKSAFIGSAISHSSLLGLSIALIFFNEVNTYSLYFVTLFISSLSVYFLARASYRQNAGPDSLIGIFYASSMALGIIIHHLFSKNKTDLMGMLFGNLLLITSEDLILFLGVSILIIPMLLFNFNKWIYTSYDEEGAINSGVNVKFFHHLFYLLLALIIVTSIKIAGTILIETLLLVPGYFALQFNTNIKKVFYSSILFSIGTSLLGLIIANFFSLPPGATLAVTQFIFLLFSYLLRSLYNKVR